jgi:6,7-dimethyl-8-ribityllumazine synthase
LRNALVTHAVRSLSVPTSISFIIVGVTEHFDRVCQRSLSVGSRDSA